MGDVTPMRRKKRGSINPSLRALMANPNFKVLANALISRGQLANIAGLTFGGKRNLYEALGYPRLIFPADYRSRFRRNAVAARIIEAKPQSTWRGGGEVIEDAQPDTNTAFEQAFFDLDRRLKLWSMFQRVDTLAGFGRYGILFYGAPGAIDAPLVKLRGPNELMYLTPYSEEDAAVQVFEMEPENARFGLPIFYSVSRMTPSMTMVPAPEVTGLVQSSNPSGGRRVHYSRCLHVADGLLDDHLFGLPRLERCWNLLDDLDKVTGGGAEAFWRRADAGLQVDVDPEMELEPADEAALDQEIDDYLHKLRRVVRTRGVKMQPLTSAVAGIKDPIDGIMSQISAGTGIPQRILMGSERGQLASTQDDDNWTQRIVDRRRDFAGPMVIIPFLDRMIELKVLPKPKAPYSVGWPELDNLDEVQRSTVAQQWASINKDMGEQVVTPNEIRDRLLGLPPLEQAAIVSLATGNKNRFLRKWACLSLVDRREYIEQHVELEDKKIRPKKKKRVA